MIFNGANVFVEVKIKKNDYLCRKFEFTMTYKESLIQQEWKEKSNEILQRDKYKCQNCGCYGFHNDTVYITDSFNDVSSILNENVLEGESLPELLKQTKLGFVECDKVTYVDLSNKPKHPQPGPYFPDGRVSWDDYDKIKIIGEHNINGLRFLEINMQNSKSLFFCAYHRIKDIYICAPEDIKHFRVHSYFKSTRNKSGCDVSLPMFIIEFDERLTSNYVVYVGSEGITVTFQNYAFYVSLHSRDVLKGLNIHHKYYVSNKKAWEYPNDALITLCESCHQKIHEQPTPCYRSLNMGCPIAYYNTCDRCLGSGYLHQYDHVQNGVCFKCCGEGVLI